MTEHDRPRLRRRRRRPAHRAAGGARAGAAAGAPGGDPGAPGPRAGLVVAGDRRRARREPPGRAQEARPALREGDGHVREVHPARAPGRGAAPRSSRGTPPPPRPAPSTCWPRCWPTSSCLATRVLAGLGAPPADLRAELDRLRMQYVDGLDADDAAALRAIGIDLDEVVRRIDRNLGGALPALPAAAVRARVEEGAGARAAGGDRAAAQLHRHRAPAARTGARRRPGRRWTRSAPSGSSGTRCARRSPPRSGRPASRPAEPAAVGLPGPVVVAGGRGGSRCGADPARRTHLWKVLRQR